MKLFSEETIYLCEEWRRALFARVTIVDDYWPPSGEPRKTYELRVWTCPIPFWKTNLFHPAYRGGHCYSLAFPQLIQEWTAGEPATWRVVWDIWKHWPVQRPYHEA